MRAAARANADQRDYPYPQSIEQDIVRGLGRVYGPYTDTCFASARETDIEPLSANMSETPGAL